MKRKLSAKFNLIIMLLSMIAGSMCLNKVAPLAEFLIKDLNLSGTSQTGIMISIFVLLGVFLAIPIGAIMEKFGYFKTGVTALFAIIVGSVIGALGTSFSVMLFSRVIEGCGLIIMATIGPVVVNRSFPAEKRGSAMGLLMCFMAFGQIIMLNVAPRIALISSWKYIWWFTAAYAAMLIVIWFVFLRDMDLELGLHSEQKNATFSKDVLLNRNMWCIGLTLVLFLIAQQGTLSFFPTYLTAVRGVSSTTAGSMVSIASIVGIFTGISVGIISDKVESKRNLLLVFMIFQAIVYAVIPFFPTKIFGFVIALFGLATMGTVGVCMSIASESTNAESNGMTIAFMNTMQWIGIFLSSTIFGILVDALGWTMTYMMLVPVCLISFVLLLLIKKKE